MIKNLEKRLDSQKYNIKKFRKIMKNIYEICFKNAVFFFFFCKVQLSSLTQSCPTLCDPMNCSMQGLPVYHQLLVIVGYKNENYSSNKGF